VADGAVASALGNAVELGVRSLLGHPWTDKKEAMASNDKSDIVSLWLVIAMIGILAGLARLPYGYYTLLRLLLCGLSLFLAFGVHPSPKRGMQWVLGVCAVLYNPLLPVRLGDKSLWTFLNFATLALFWIADKSRNRSAGTSSK
jgi:hypothetical protein